MWQQGTIQSLSLQSEQSLIDNTNDKVNSLNKFSLDSELIISWKYNVPKWLSVLSANKL